jgi:replicative DNA helicase
MDNLFSMEAEQLVIGGLMIDADAWDRVSDILSPQSFYDRRHGLVFSTIKVMAGKAQRIDGPLVRDTLKKAGRLDEAGGIAYLSELIKNTSGTYNIAAYAEKIKNYADLRRLTKAVFDCGAVLSDPDATIAEKAQRAATVILEAADDGSTDADLYTMKDGAKDLYDWLNKIHMRGGVLSGIPTGFADIDQRMNGLHGGEVIVVAARPGMGKTNFALNVAGNTARQGSKVFFSSMEMSKRELSARMAAHLNNMDYGALQAMDWDRFSPALSAFIAGSDSLSIRIDDRASQTVERIRIAAKKAKRQMGGLDLIVIDYLQLIKGEGSSRYEQVTNISRDLKVMAKDMDVPVLCLAQINRASTDRTDKRPLMSDLRDSGAIEQDADAVIMLHREDEKDGSQGDFAEAIFRKLRHGQMGTDPLVVDFNHCRFRTADRTSWMETQKQAPEKKKDNRGYGN